MRPIRAVCLPLRLGTAGQGRELWVLLGAPHRVDLCLSSNSAPAHKWGGSISNVTDGRAAVLRGLGGELKGRTEQEENSRGTELELTTVQSYLCSMTWAILELFEALVSHLSNVG